MPKLTPIIYIITQSIILYGFLIFFMTISIIESAILGAIKEFLHWWPEFRITGRFIKNRYKSLTEKELPK